MIIYVPDEVWKRGPLEEKRDIKPYLYFAGLILFSVIVAIAISALVRINTNLIITECYISDVDKEYKVSQPLSDFLRIDFDQIERMETSGDWRFVLFSDEKGFLPVDSNYEIRDKSIGQIFLKLEDKMDEKDMLTVTYQDGSVERFYLELLGERAKLEIKKM